MHDIRDIHGSAATAGFLEDIAKLHEFAQNFGVYKCNTLRLNEFHRLVITALVKYSHNSEIRNTFLNTIVAAVDFQPRWTSLHDIKTFEELTRVCKEMSIKTL